MCITFPVPSVVTSVPSNISMLEGEIFSISFSFLAIPAPNLTWYINDIQDTFMPTPEANNSHTMSFTATEEGWYHCVVENELGSDEYSVFVDILSKPQLLCIAGVTCNYSSPYLSSPTS